MVQKKERTLLIQVTSLDKSNGPPPSAALHAEMRDVVRRSGASDEPNALQSRHYSRHARLCMVRCSHKISRDVKTAIGTIRYVQQYPVKLEVLRMYGNERLARRALAARIEIALRDLPEGDLDGQKALTGLLDTLCELQK